jgi:diguanylate cyclase
MASDGNGRKSVEQELLIKLLSRGLSRLAVAAQGLDVRLDGMLADLRKHLRKDGYDAAELNALIDAIDARIKHVDDERGRYAGALQEALERLISQLLELRPTRPVAGDLKALQKQLRDVQDDDGLVPVLFSLASLQGQALGELPPRPGLLSRLFGDRDRLAGAIAGEPAPSSSGAEADIDEREDNLPRTGGAEAVPAPASPAAGDAGSALAPAQELSAEDRDAVTSVEQEPAFSRVSAAVCAVISQLLRQIEPPPQAADNHRSILERIAAGLNWYELVPTLEDLSFVVLAALERDRGEFHQYLLQLNQRLATATQVLQASKEHQFERRQADDALSKTVRGNIEAMQQQVAEATDLHLLKGEVATRLESVMRAMDTHQLSEQQRQVAMEQHLTTLEQRIHAMEEQSAAMEQQMVEQRRLALVDILTQLPNRSAYEERLAYEVDRWQRYRRPLALAICDIDYFKAINDKFGHLAGDKVLKILARTLRARLRRTDFIARYGGEEFVVLLPETELHEALKAVEMIREAVASCPFHFREQPLQITLSAGIASFGDGDDATAVFERADRALYRAKECGRNRCELAESAPAS